MDCKIKAKKLKKYPSNRRPNYHKEYNQKPERKEYLKRWLSTKPNYFRDYWRKKRKSPLARLHTDNLQEARQFMNEYLKVF